MQTSCRAVYALVFGSIPQVYFVFVATSVKNPFKIFTTSRKKLGQREFKRNLAANFCFVCLF